MAECSISPLLMMSSMRWFPFSCDIDHGGDVEVMPVKRLMNAGIFSIPPAGTTLHRGSRPASGLLRSGFHGFRHDGEVQEITGAFHEKLVWTDEKSLRQVNPDRGEQR